VENDHDRMTVIGMTPDLAGTRGARRMTADDRTTENMTTAQATTAETATLSSQEKRHPEVADNTATRARIDQASTPKTIPIVAAPTRVTPVNRREQSLAARTPATGTVTEPIRVARPARVNRPVVDLREGRFRFLLHLLLPQPPELRIQRAKERARTKARTKERAREKNATSMKPVKNGRKLEHASTSINVQSHGVRLFTHLTPMRQPPKSQPQHLQRQRTLPLPKGEATTVLPPIVPEVIDAGEVPIETVIAIEAATAAHKLESKATEVVATRANVVKGSEKLLRRPPGSQ
jgi:hypothetical protein